MKLTLNYPLLAIFIIFYTQIAESASAPWVGTDLINKACSGGPQGYGPFDYLQKSQFKKELELVETAHFTPEVENLIKGNTSTHGPAGDIDYTLRAWPNHHKALLSIIKYQINILKKINPYHPLTTLPECYLKRAINFSPTDAFTVSLYGYYLRKIGKLDSAKEYYTKAMKLSPDNIRISYSFALLLIELNEYEEAVKYAQIAYRDKGTPNGLKNILKKAEVWKDN